MNKQKKGKLYLIPTPLSENSLDKMVTNEMNSVIKDLNFFLAENIRTSRRFISSLKLGKIIEDLHFDILDKNTSAKEIRKLCTPLLQGRDLGVLSEAGCPGIADPGNLVSTFAHQHDIEVIPLVGPSSIFMALMASGFNGQSFVFHGYLPIDKQKRMQFIKAIVNDAINKKQTQIFMETPYRNNSLFADLMKYCRPYTRLCVAKDISGAMEMIKTQTILEWKKSKPDLHKVPTVFLIYS
jgi:16S rRNA (cytidine1402-2'-O)-methyltransferase